MTTIYYTDGSAEPTNPGPTGWGVYCKTTGYKGYGNSGHQTNNFAEWEALRQALLHAKKNKYEEVEIRMDSKMVAEQFNMYWKINCDNLLRIGYETIFMKKFFKNVEAIWIPREENTIADELSTRWSKEEEKLF